MGLGYQSPPLVNGENMGHFLDVALKVLSEAGRVLSVREITDIGIQRGWLKTSGKTPHQTMKSKLSTDILQKRGQSRFMRTDKGEFGLREWKAEEVKEYIAERFEKRLLEEEVVVFPAGSLGKYIYGTGLHDLPADSIRELLAERRSMLRREAELDYSVIQLVSGFVVRFGRHYLTYKRSRRLPESRLHGYYSIMFGGHLNPEDVSPLFVDIFDSKVGASLLVRELSEELVIPRDEPPTLAYKGLLYDGSREPSSQHLAIVYDVLLKSRNYQIGERGFLMDPRFETLDEIEARLGDFENWSVLIARHERGRSD